MTGDARTVTIALAGNPNSGKTTIFNAITGVRQKVGNWPGVTVEKKEGRIWKNGIDLKIVDLPGTYSLTPFSIEEIVARDFVLDDAPDVVIDIIDASNLERSLYLATQLRELDCNVVFALNMMDQAESRGIKIDTQKLSELLDVPVVETIGNRKKGIDALLNAAIALSRTESVPQKRKVRYNHEIEKAVAVIRQHLETLPGADLPYPARWTAIKLIEDDAIIKERLTAIFKDKAGVIFEAVRRQRQILMDRFSDDPEIITTDERYGFISGIIKEVLFTSTMQRVDISRNIDLILTHRYVGMPIFFFFIWAMFQLTFTIGAYPQEWIEAGFNLLARGMGHLLPQGWVADLLLDGVIQGVGTVAVFLPNILILFFCIALFEDTGYMARVAFLMDKIMHMVGLHGKSFIPMLMGFGCNVPAIMASRTLESKTDRLLTIMITPFMSCSAKLPVYIILAGAFFGAQAGSVIFGIYILGILLSIVTGRIFRSTLFKGADAPFVMELPPYRVPMLKSLMIHMWDRSKLFIKRMGGIILIGSIIIWGLANFPHASQTATAYSNSKQAVDTRYDKLAAEAPDEAARNRILAQRRTALADLGKRYKSEKTAESFLGQLGRLLAPVFHPIGVDWRGGIALLSGFVAKEIVVSTLGVLYAVTDDHAGDALQDALRASGMTPLSALST
ncbi:MAG: ferrous iron transport protein B, partial [Desulfatitalea sp.]|nr:ferrous iron transport protein B [Desulfatitalea sp.]NNK02029.1 ferrous iron transport protein B [Desulfatitalea sp.]